MRATVGVRGLELECIIGVHPHERDTPQPLHVDVEVDTDVAAAVETQRLADTLNYEVLAEIVREHGARRFQLIEAFANATAVAVLEHFGSAAAVRVEVRKPNAVPNAAGSFVRLERRR